MTVIGVVLPLALYGGLGFSLDARSTNQAVSSGRGREANPLVATIGTTPAKVLGTALFTYGDVLLQQRCHRRGVWVYRAVVTGAFVALKVHNDKEGR